MSLGILLFGCAGDAFAPSDQPTISLSIVSGNGQSGVVGAELPNALTIRALDNGGHPIADLTVNFRVTSGGGSVFAGVAVTNNNGVAREYWTLGTSTAQVQTLEVRVVKPNGVKQVFGSFTATALAGSPAQISAQAGAGQTAPSGTIVPIPPAVLVSDQFGNPVPAATVTFAIGSGGGSITGAVVTTDASGIASVGSWTLGTQGVNTLTATVAGSGISGNPITFSATATAVVGWQSLASMPTPRYGLATGIVNGIVYAVGGYDGSYLGSVEAYDPATNTWTTKASLPTPRFGLSVGVVNGILYAVGGYDSGQQVGTVEAYDPATNIWTTKASMPTPRASLSVGVVNGILYAVGGNLNSPLGTVEAYDPATDSWTAKASLPTPRYQLSLGVINGILYAVGGYDFGTVATVEAYDPATNSWTTRAAMPTLRFGLSVGVVNGILYAMGGNTNGTMLATVEAYDPTTNSWTIRAPMPTPRMDLSVAVVNGILYAMGGGYGTAAMGTVFGTVEALSP